MLRKKGFTLVEMMVVVLIVAILATAAVPILRGQLDKAKWVEGRTFMGTIAAGIQSYIALNDPRISMFFRTKDGPDAITFTDLGLTESDFNGKYFTTGHFEWVVSYNAVSRELTYEVSGFTGGTGITYPVMITLDQDGKWVEN